MQWRVDRIKLPPFNRGTLCNCCVETVSRLKLKLRAAVPGVLFFSCSRQTRLWTRRLCKKKKGKRWQRVFRRFVMSLYEATCHSRSLNSSAFREKLWNNCNWWWRGTGHLWEMKQPGVAARLLRIHFWDRINKTVWNCLKITLNCTSSGQLLSRLSLMYVCRRGSASLIQKAVPRVVAGENPFIVISLDSAWLTQQFINNHNR